MLNFGRFSHISFDCYGTLIDWESGILATLMPLMAHHGVEMDAANLLEAYAEAEEWAERQFVGPSEEQAHKSYRAVLGETVSALGNRFGFAPTVEERGLLAERLPTWPPFGDTIESLTKLATRYELVVLSNIDRDLFAGTQDRLGVNFSAVISAEELEIYKPAPLFFEMAHERLAVPKHEWLHVAQSCFHDIAPAQAYGLSTVRVDRRHGSEGSGATPPSAAVADLTCRSLAELLTCMDL